jgi:hypothetical protein
VIFSSDLDIIKCCIDLVGFCDLIRRWETQRDVWPCNILIIGWL